MMDNRDSRTDNWAGYTDYNRSSYHRFPRSAREAGFYYGNKVRKQHTLFWICMLLILVMGCVVWAG